MSRRLRKYYLQEETGIVFQPFFNVNNSQAATPSYDTVWLDRDDHTIWVVDFNSVPATVTQTDGNNIDGWVLNDGYFIFIASHQLRVSNNSALLTARFRSVPTSVTLPLAVSTVTGELLHGS